jgi:hypothetical protein
MMHLVFYKQLINQYHLMQNNLAKSVAKDWESVVETDKME